MKILCPVDFSEQSLNALEFASKIAEKHQGNLTLMHVYAKEALKKFLERENRNLDKSGDDSFMMNSSETILKDLTDTINGLQRNHRSNYYFTIGSVKDNIIDYANKHSYDLVVMGTDGISDAFEKFTGSTTLQITDNINCPMLCIPTGTGYRDFEKIVYASDYQQEDKEALKSLITFTKPFDPAITVLHLYKKDTSFEEAHYKRFVEEIKSYFPAYPLEFVDKQIQGDVYLGIHEFMLQNEADLLGLFHHHKNIFQKLFETSTTEEVTYAANYPVIIFK